CSSLGADEGYRLMIALACRLILVVQYFEARVARFLILITLTNNNNDNNVKINSELSFSKNQSPRLVGISPAWNNPATSTTENRKPFELQDLFYFRANVFVGPRRGPALCLF